MLEFRRRHLYTRLRSPPYPRAPESAPREANIGLSTNRKRVLCVEDHADTLELVRVALSQYDVVGTASCAEAVQLMTESGFDLYLLDNFVRDGRGLELCRLIRERHGSAPIILWSAGTDWHKEREVARMHNVRLLNKPVEVERLTALAVELLEAGEARQAAADASSPQA